MRVEEPLVREFVSDEREPDERESDERVSDEREVPLVREEVELLAGVDSRLTVVVRPVVSVVLMVVWVVPLLRTRVSTVVEGSRFCVVCVVVPEVRVEEPDVPEEVEEPEVLEELEELEVLEDELEEDDCSEVLAAWRWVSVRSWPALRTVTPEPLGVSWWVTRCSNDSFGCCVA